MPDMEDRRLAFSLIVMKDGGTYKCIVQSTSDISKRIVVGVGSSREEALHEATHFIGWISTIIAVEMNL